MKPVCIALDVPNARDEVFAFLDVMANHETFTDHLLKDWEYSGPERGIGSKARVRSKAGGRVDVIEIEVIDADPPVRIVEQNVGANGRRRATGTYTLEDLPHGGTRVAFEYSWKQAPLAERLAAPLARAVLRRGSRRALERLAAQLSAGTAEKQLDGHHSPSSPA
jgi:Polyketide cyclase / dehydrase and lipid transport